LLAKRHQKASSFTYIITIISGGSGLQTAAAAESIAHNASREIPLKRVYF
jgi:hypothetical protein